MTALVIDINSDVGESFGAFRQGADEELFPLISSANVACGFHGGDPRTMERTVEMLTGLGIAIGAHPSFPDLVGFGRRVIQATPEEIRADVIYQLGALRGFCDIAGVPLHHVKPHGALYNLAARDATVAEAIAGAVRAAAPAAIIYAQAGSALEQAACEAGLRVAREAFADRACMADGSLAPRHLEGAILTDPTAVAERVIRIIRGEPIPTIDGDPIVIEAETICIHSDTPPAVPIAATLRHLLAGAGVIVKAPR